MNAHRTLPSTHRRAQRTLLVGLCAMVLASCSAPAMRPDGSSDLSARLARLQADPQLSGRAPAAFQDAEAAVHAATQPQTDPMIGQHLVFMADHKISLAEVTARNAYLIEHRSALATTRSRMLLDERTREADQANTRTLDARADTDLANARTRDARADAEDERQRAGAAGAQAADARADADAQQRSADQARLEARTARGAAADAQGASEQLQQQLDALHARVTDRGTVVTLGDVLFAFGTADLNSGGNHHLLELSAFLARYPDRNAAIEGFTDNIGSKDYNLGLSQRRAEAVKDFLVGQGIAASRLTAIGKGKETPVGDNSSPTGRQQNRRVEVIIANSIVSSLN